MKDQKTPEEIKTLQDCKDEVAKSYSFENWEAMKLDLWNTVDYVTFRIRMFARADEAAELYAQTISEGKDREIEELREALTEISNLCGTTNLSSQNQMREAIKGAVEITDTALNKVH